MEELTPLIRDLTIMLGIASIVAVLFQKIRQPVVFGYIIAGIIIGPHTLPYSFISNVTQVETLSELGVIFLMFSLGLNFSFHKLKRVGFSVTITGILKVIIIATLSFYVGKILNLSFYDCLFLGAALSISSTTIIFKALEELKLNNKRFADVVFGILIIEDLLAILILALLSTIVATEKIFSFDMFWITIKLIFVISCWFLAGYFIVPILFQRIIKYINQETLTLVSVALCLILVATAAYFHFSAALGSFIMGSILAETSVVNRVKQLISPLRDVFAAIFFISIGMLINIKVLIIQWPAILAIVSFTIVSTIFITSISAFLSGQSLNTSLRVGFSMPPIGEFSFVILSLGLILNVTSNSLYQLVVGTATITIFVTPFLIKLSEILSKTLEKNLSKKIRHCLESYSAWLYRTMASYQKQIAYRKFLSQLVINGIIVAFIFTSSKNYILPQLINLKISIDSAEILIWMLALMFSSPFIWGMLFAFKVTHPTSKIKQFPHLFFGGSITIFETIILSITYFHTWYITTVISITTIILFGLFYKQLGRSYRWFERRLEHALKRKNKKQTQYEELAPWDTHLVEMITTNQAQNPIIGKTLIESRLKQKFGVNIVAIHRGPNKIIIAPHGNEKIMLQDKLVVLGNDEQIDAFKESIGSDCIESVNENILKDFVLKPLMLENDHPLIGQSIKHSKIREKINGTIVGLERNGFRILNPNSATTLKEHDLLLLVGKKDAMRNCVFQ